MADDLDIQKRLSELEQKAAELARDINAALDMLESNLAQHEKDIEEAENEAFDAETAAYIDFLAKSAVA